MAANFTLIENYRLFYNDPRNNVYTDYTAVYPNYLIPVGNAPTITPVDLASLVYFIATPNLPADFLLLGTNGCITCCHQLARFPARMGLPITSWDGEGYASINNLMYDQTRTVSWDTEFLNVAGHII